MKLPGLPYSGGSSRREQVAFGGVNYAEDAREGELRESHGLSAKDFPAISQRGGREQVYKCTTPNSVFAWGKLCVVDGTSLLYDGEQVGNVEDGPKQFAVVNTKLCIFPDKRYLDLENLEFKGLDDSISSKTGTNVVFTGNSLSMDTEELAGRIAPKCVQWFLNMSSYPRLLTEEAIVEIRRYSGAVWEDGEWVLSGESVVRVSSLAVGNILMLRRSEISGVFTLNLKSYTRRTDGSVVTDTVHEGYSDNDDRGCYAVVTGVTTVNRPDIGFDSYNETTISCEIHDATKAESLLTARFSVGDRVDITGCTVTANNMEKAVVKVVEDNKLTFADNTFTAHSQTAQVTVRRPVPDLSFICESDNRLWGCEGHTIYASALGDPKNFYVYDGLSTDSYAVAVGTDGDFTGCVAYSGNVLFWKEQCLHKILGSYPAEYGVYTYDINGVQEGSANSMVIVNEVLYYKGRSGVYAYTGGTPILISSALGNRHFDQAAGGSDGRRYYISMREIPSEMWGLYAYDIQNRLWLREDDARVKQFANLGGVLYALHTGGEVWKLEQDTEERVAWSAELVPFRDGTMERKRTVRLSLRLELSAGATVAVETREDLGPWRRVWQSGNGRSRIFNIPIHPRRCDEFSVRISGKGKCIVRTLAREIQAGSGL